MRADETQICNMAIGYCGSTDWIQSIDDTSVSARRCKRFYAIALEKVLRIHDWACATYSIELAKNTTAPTVKYDNAYAIPNDSVKVVQVYGDNAGYSPYDRWIVKGRNIETDLDQVWVDYIRYPEDVKDLDILLADSIAWELAEMLAPTLVKNPQIFALISQSKEKAQAKARAMDSMEDKELYTQNSVLEDARIVTGTSIGAGNGDR